MLATGTGAARPVPAPFPALLHERSFRRMSKPLRIAAASLLAAAAFASPAAAKVGGANGRIVFNEGDLAYSVNPDGSDLRFVHEAFAPRFSSDGSRLAAGAPR